jgi:hypothetical protein
MVEQRCQQGGTCRWTNGRRQVPVHQAFSGTEGYGKDALSEDSNCFTEEFLLVEYLQERWYQWSICIGSTLRML